MRPAVFVTRAAAMEEAMAYRNSASAAAHASRGPRLAGRLASWCRIPLFFALVLVAAGPSPARAAPEGQLTWGVHISLAPTWFDPGEMPSLITPYMVMYALHDSLVKAMPDNPMSPSLAESWSTSPDGLTYEFVLRKGAKFHNGDDVTSADVKFSFDRYHGTSKAILRERV